MPQVLTLNPLGFVVEGDFVRPSNLTELGTIQGLQRVINQHQSVTGGSTRVSVDGVIGPETFRAVGEIDIAPGAKAFSDNVYASPSALAREAVQVATSIAIMASVQPNFTPNPSKADPEVAARAEEGSRKAKAQSGKTFLKVLAWGAGTAGFLWLAVNALQTPTD